MPKNQVQRIISLISVNMRRINRRKEIYELISLKILTARANQKKGATKLRSKLL